MRAWIDLGLEHRTTLPGLHHHAATTDHVVNMLLGDPVRVSCRPRGLRSVRSRLDINVLPAGYEDAWYEDDAAELLELRVPSSLVRLAAEEIGLDPDRTEITERCHVQDAQIQHLASALAADARAGSPGGLVYREALGLALAIHLVAKHRAPSAARRGLAPAKLARVKEYIEAHLAEDVSLHRLARVAGISASHLRVLFKEAVGTPMHAYVVQRRVERARSLLRSGDLSAAQVAAEAGFAHQSHMARCMRRVLGVTPTGLARART